MGLTAIGTVPLPPHRGAGGFDHAGVDPAGGRLYIAHTGNDAIEVVDLQTRNHVATLAGFPGIAGAAVDARQGSPSALWRCHRQSLARSHSGPSQTAS